LRRPLFLLRFLFVGLVNQVERVVEFLLAGLLLRRCWLLLLAALGFQFRQLGQTLLARFVQSSEMFLRDFHVAHTLPPFFGELRMHLEIDRVILRC
jgi:hypothetical protein